MTRRLAPLLVLLLVTACGSSPDGESTTTTTLAATSTTVGDPRIPVIFDYSPTVSDLGALIFLAVHPDVRLLAVTLPGPGESHCPQGVAHTRGVLVALGQADVPVACGVDEGYGALNPFPAEWRANADGVDTPEAEPNETRSPVDLIADLVMASNRPVEIVAVGPLTNLALLADAHPEALDRIAGITIMGGAVDVAGNVPLFAWENANGYAEVNFWVDPEAAARVIGSGVPITLVPLDATDYVPADAKFRSALLSPPATAASEILGDVWRDAPEWIQGGYYLWDELAAAVLVEPALVEFETRSLVVDIGSDAVAGWSREDSAGAPVSVAVSADRVAFETLFLSTVLDRPVTIERLVATAAEREYFEAVEGITVDFDAAQEEIFLAAAGSLGYDAENLPEEAWAEIIAIAAPEILSGPMAELRAALAVVVAPESLATLHGAWIASLDDVLAHGAEILEALTADPGDELPYITPFLEACGALTDAALQRGLAIELTC